jgi:hypothetical protein
MYRPVPWVHNMRPLQNQSVHRQKVDIRDEWSDIWLDCSRDALLILRFCRPADVLEQCRLITWEGVLLGTISAGRRERPYGAPSPRLAPSRHHDVKTVQRGGVCSLPVYTVWQKAASSASISTTGINRNRIHLLLKCCFCHTV